MKNRIQTALLAMLLVPATLVNVGCGEEPQQEAQVPQDIYIDVHVPAPTVITREIYVPREGDQCSNPHSPVTTGDIAPIAPNPAAPTDTVVATNPPVVEPTPAVISPTASNPLLAATPSVEPTPATSAPAPSTATQMPLLNLGS